MASSRDKSDRQLGFDEDSAVDLAKARTLFKAKEYGEANKYLMRVIWYCDCNHDSLQNLLQNAANKGEALAVDPVNPCFCKNFLARVRQSKSETKSPGGKGPVLTAKFGPDFVPPQNTTCLDIQGFRHILAQPCFCGSGQKACSSQLHAAALDSLAVLSLAQDQPRLALDYAFRMINLAPTDARGYLRAGQLLQSAFAAPGRLEAGVRDTIRCVYRHGIENAKESLQEPAIWQLQRSVSRWSRMDIIGSLPPELAAYIIDHLDLRAILTCRHVCGGWRTLLKNDEHFWSRLEFDPQSRPSSAHFRNLVQSWCRGKIAKLVIADALKFDRAMLKVLVQSSGVLRHLELHGVIPGQLQPSDTWQYPSFAFKNLTSFQVTHSARPDAVWFWPILQSAKNSLEFVGLSGMGGDFPSFIPRLNNTKSLTLEGRASRNGTEHVRITMDLLAHTAPNAEHIYLNHCTILEQASEIFPMPVSIFFGSRTCVLATSPLSILWILSPNLRSLDMMSESVAVVFDKWLKAATTMPQLHLEHFRCVTRVEPTDIRRFLDFSIKSGSLRSLCLGNPTNEDMVDLSENPIGVDTVTTLGMQDICFQNTHDYKTEFTGRPFLDWVAKYPKVTTVAAYPASFDGAMKVIRGLVKMAADSDACKPVPRIRTIYQDCLKGTAMDRIMAKADKVGVQIVHTKEGYMPPVLPFQGKFPETSTS